MGDCPSSVAENIKKARSHAGLTQKQLAEKIGATETTISYYESKTRTPRIEQLSRIAEVLGVTVDNLLTGRFESGLDGYSNEAIESLKSLVNTDDSTGIRLSHVLSILLECHEFRNLLSAMRQHMIIGGEARSWKGKMGVEENEDLANWHKENPAHFDRTTFTYAMLHGVFFRVVDAIMKREL